MMLPFHRALISGLCSAALLLALAPGCSQFDLQKKMPWLTGKTGEFRRPMRVVTMWSDTVLTTPGQAPVRGFGARLMFYGLDEEKPIKVAGSLVVYAFDEANRDKTNTRPDRKFVFTEEQFAKHYSKSDLGHSYSIWAPWDEVGGEPKEISLIVRFTPVEGGVVVSEQVKQFLPGENHPQPPVQAPINQTPPYQQSPPYQQASPYQQTAQYPQAAPDQGEIVASPVQLVNYQASPEEAAQRRMTSTTIVMPPLHGGRPPSALTRPRATRSALPSAAMQPWEGNQLPGGQQTRPSGFPAAQSGFGVNAPQAQSFAPDQATLSAAGYPAATPGYAPAAARGANPQAASQAWISRYARPRSRALGGPIAQLSRDRAPMRPSPAAPQYAPPGVQPAMTAPGAFPNAVPTSP